MDLENNEGFIEGTNYERILRVIALKNENKNENRLKLGVINIDLKNVKDYHFLEYEKLINDFASEYHESLMKIFNMKFAL